MSKYKGEVLVNRELKAGEISILEAMFNNDIEDLSKPNKGLFPFKFYPDYTGFYAFAVEAYELDAVLPLVFNKIPNLSWSGYFDCEDEENPHKLWIENNRIQTIPLGADAPPKQRYLKCPHCQKVFRREDFKEDYGQ